MIVVRILLQIKPENRQQFISLMTEDTAISRGYAGCQKFELFQDMTNEHRFILYQEWDAQANFDVYRNSDYLKDRGGSIFPLLAGQPDAAYYQISHTI